jgi:hypothetical protein
MNDAINGLFEVIGGVLCWINVVKLYRDKTVRGIYWPVVAFFSAWGLWNLHYYPSLGQWCSFWGGVLMTVGNVVWVILAVYYQRRGK